MNFKKYLPIIAISSASEDGQLGNISEDLMFLLYQARRENRKLLFVKKWNPFKKYTKFSANYMYDLECEFLYKRGFLHKLLSILFGFRDYVVLYLLAKLYYKTLNKYFSNDKNFRTFMLIIGFPLGVNRRFNPDALSMNKYIENRKEYNFSSEFEESLNIEIPKSDSISLERDLELMGVSKKDWFVCVQVRTKNFFNDVDNNIKNSSFDNYYETIRYIINEGGKVIRFGDAGLDVENIDGLINYPDSKFKSEKMDYYIMQKCRYFIGTGSGPRYLALLMHKPTLIVNYTDYWQTPVYKKKDQFIFKRVYSKKINKYLTLNEIINQDRPYADMELVVEDNSSEDILLAYIEFINRIKRDNFDYSSIQEEYKTKIVSLPYADSNFENLFGDYLFTRNYYSNATVSNAYLKKYWDCETKS